MTEQEELIHLRKQRDQLHLAIDREVATRRRYRAALEAILFELNLSNGFDHSVRGVERSRLRGLAEKALMKAGAQ